jgi:hypothetical protein
LTFENNLLIIRINPNRFLNPCRDKKMRCKCTGNIIKFNNYKPKRGDPFAQCDKCLMLYTWKEYRALQADKIVEAFGKRIRKE